MTYNQRVLLALRNRRFDDSQIAQMVGASRTTVNQIINGKRSGRNIEPRIRKVAQALNLTSEELGIETSNTVVKIPPIGLKTPPEPTSAWGKIKEGVGETFRAIPRMAEAKLITDRNESKEAKKQRQHNTTQQEKPLPKASKVKPGDIVEVNTRAGRPKRKPGTSQSSKMWKRAAHYPSVNQTVRQLMGVDTPETPDAEEQESLITLKTLPDGRLSVGIKQDAQGCIYCQRRPGTMLLPYGQGFTCPECNRNHSSDPRVYRPK